MCHHRLAVFVVLVGLIASLAAAQEQPAGRELQTQVVPVSHIDARGIAQALTQLEYPIRVSAPDSGRLIVQGYPDEIESALALVQQLDAPGVPAGSEESVAYIPLGNYPTDRLMEMVETVAPGGFGTAYALDDINRMLVIRAAEPTIKKVRELIKAIDHPAAGLTVEFFFIGGTISPNADGAESAVPAAIKAVANSLIANGMRNLTLMAPIVISAHDGQTFRTESTLSGGPNGDAAVPPVLHLYVEGKAHLPEGGQNVQLEVRADATAGGVRYFSANTTLSTKLGAYSILAAAPANAGEKNAIAVAMRVMRAE